jgi:hypothetical protein
MFQVSQWVFLPGETGQEPGTPLGEAGVPREQADLDRTSVVAVAEVSRRVALPQSLLKIVRYGPNEDKISPKSRRWFLLS